MWILKKRSLWERHVLDLWSIPHTLFGTLIAYACLAFGINVWRGLLLCIVLAALWELFEKITRLSDVEHRINGWSDVIVAQVGYGVGILLFITTDAKVDTVIASASASVFVLVCVLGWLSHHWYGKK
jgi:hypothetical protein